MRNNILRFSAAMTKPELDELTVLKWLYERKLFSSLIALEEETGISLHHAKGRIRVIRDLCISGDLTELDSLISHMFPNDSSLVAAIAEQALMEKLFKLESKQDVISFISALQNEKPKLSPTTISQMESALTSSDAQKHAIFTDWNIDKGRYMLFEKLLVKLRPLFPHSFSSTDSTIPEETSVSRKISPSTSSIKFESFTMSEKQFNPGKIEYLSKYVDDSNQPIRSAQFSNDGRMLAIGTNSHSLLLCGLSSRNDINVMGKSQKIHSGSVYTCAWSPDDRWVATGSNDQTIRLNPVSQLLGETVEKSGSRIQLQLGTIRSLSFVNSVTLSCAFSGDSTVRGVDVSTGKTIWGFANGQDGYTNTVDCILDTMVLAASSTGHVSLVDAKSLESLWKYANVCSSVVAAISGNYLSVGSEAGDVFLFDIRKGTDPLWAHEGIHSGSVRMIDFDRSNQFLASASFDKTIKVFDVSTAAGSTAATLDSVHTDRIVSVCWNPVSDVLVSCGTDSAVVLWGS
jgi:WD40 repeat protein